MPQSTQALSGPDTRSKNKNKNQTSGGTPTITGDHQHQSVNRTISPSPDIWTLISERLEAFESKLFNKVEEIKLEFRKRISDLESEIETRFTEYTTIINEKLQQSSHRIIDLEARIDFLERRNHAEDIILNGVPATDTEDLSMLFTTLCTSLNISSPPSPAQILRIKPKSSLADTPIKIKFNTVRDRNIFLKSASDKRKKSPLTLRDVGLQSDKRIFVHESLSKKHYSLFREANRLKRRQMLQTVFTRSGLVFIRRTEGSPIVNIKSLDELRIPA